MAWDRYAYTFNNPVKYTDPSGHSPCLDDGYCGKQVMQTGVRYWKWIVKSIYDITLSKGSKDWTEGNAKLVYDSLGKIDVALGGQLKSLVGGSTFKMGEHEPLPGENTTYDGATSDGSTILTFNTLGNATLRQMNIFHEVGHLLDNAPGLLNVFSGALGNEANPGFIDDGFLNRDALAEEYFVTTDPNYDYAQALQHLSTDPVEQWADIFANYVAGNIDMKKPTGRAMYYWTKKTLSPYIGNAAPIVHTQR